MRYVLATAGHVDHGKSTLVRALTGMETDRWAEERRRGLTLDLGFAWTEVDGEHLAFVDVPGHERFVTTMLAGIGPVPAVLFVVAADGGWMPQSAEHLAALDALGVRHGVLAVTRCDLADPAPARGRALTEIARTTLGRVPAVEVAAPTGRGLPELRAALADVVRATPAPDAAAPVRLWVDRSFSIGGAGTVVTGTLGAGTVRVGDELLLEPGGWPVRVRGVQSEGAPAAEVGGTSRAALNLRGVDHTDVRRGQALVTAGAWTSSAEVDVRLDRGTDGPLPARATLHAGSAAVPARLRPLGLDVVRLRLEHPLPWHVGDRGLLREPGTRTVLGGFAVLDVRPPPITRRGGAAARARLLARTAATDVQAHIRRCTVVHERDLAARGYRLPGTPLTGGWYVDPAALPRLAGELRTAVAGWCRDHPLDDGLPVEAARRRLDLPDAALVDVVRRHAGLTSSGGRIGPQVPDGLPPDVRRAVDTVLAGLAGAPFAAPDALQLAALRLGHRELAAAVRAGALLGVADGIVLAPGSDTAAAAVLAALPQPFTVSQARQALGTTRRVAVPLLELLDRRRLTRRLADDRRQLLDVVAPAAERGG